MKNLLLSAILFVSASSLWAQAPVLTEANIQGKWKLVTYSTDEVSLDLTTGKAKVKDAAAKKLGTAYVENLKKETEALTEQLKFDYLEINGKKFSLLSDNVVKTGSYKIGRDKKNNPTVTATFRDTSKSTVPLIMKDGKLVLKQKYTGKVFTFAKIE